VEITASKEQSRKIVEAMDKILEMPTGEVKQIQLLPAMIWAQLLANDPRLLDFDVEGEKTNAIIEQLEGSLHRQRVVIFSKYRRTIDLKEKLLTARKHKVVRITGKESIEEKTAAKDHFMSDGRDHVPILMMTRAGQRAINLQKGGILLTVDMPWSYIDYRQLTGRLKRTGSTHQRIAVFRYLTRLHPDVARQVGTEETIDHYTLSVVHKKQKNWRAITGDAESIESNNSDVGEIYQMIRGSYRSKAAA
jgi:SNF2 family DNA or RNA helicase